MKGSSILCIHTTLLTVIGQGSQRPFGAFAVFDNLVHVSRKGLVIEQDGRKFGPQSRYLVYAGYFSQLIFKVICCISEKNETKKIRI